MSSNVVRGVDLYRFVEEPDRLRAFLEDRPDRLGPPSTLSKSIVVLQGNVGSLMSVVDSTTTSLPMITRSGKYSASMRVPELEGLGNPISIDADEQRFGCYYIDHRSAARGISKALWLIVGVPPKKIVYDEQVLLKLFHSNAGGVLEALNEAISACGARDFRVATNKLAFLRRKHFLEEAEHADLPGLREALEHGESPSVRLEGVPLERALRGFWSAICARIHSVAHMRTWRVLDTPDRRHYWWFQGCGDISMNYWNVAYTQKTGWIRVLDEPMDRREYSCLIAWSPELSKRVDLVRQLKDAVDRKQVAWSGDVGRSGLSIGIVRGHPWGGAAPARLMVNRPGLDEPDPLAATVSVGEASDAGQAKPVPAALELAGDVVQYVLYGQLLVWQGKPVEHRKVIRECSDLRHVLAMPNMNPEFKTRWKSDEAFEKVCELVDWESRKCAPSVRDHMNLASLPSLKDRPRVLFGLRFDRDLWLGEYALIRDPQLAQTACEHAVDIALSDLGTSLDWATLSLLDNGYELRSSRDSVAREGDFAWDFEDPANPQLVIFFKRAVYPCTLVGIGKLGSRLSKRDSPAPDSAASSGELFLLAWGHRFDEDQAYTVFECAEYLRSLGAEAVLMIDEGQDVFQQVLGPEHVMDLTEIKDVVPPPRNRTRSRGTLMFWTEDGEAQ